MEQNTDHPNSYFVVDIANRVMHELELTISSGYLGIDVGIGSLSNIADGLLQTHLLVHSPVDMNTAGWLLKLVMRVALVIYSLASGGSQGSQIWSVVEQIQTKLDFTPTYVKDLAATAAGMLLLFSIGWTIFAISFIRKIPLDHATRKRLQWAAAVLAASFLGRNILVFVFFLLYSQYEHTAGDGVQLAYLALYGLGSVMIWTSILMIAGSHEERKSGQGAIFSPLEQRVDDERYGQPYHTYAYVPKII